MIPRRRVGLVLIAAAGSLLVLAFAPAPRPSRLSWDELDRWYLEVGPAVAAVSFARLVAEVAAGWLVLVSGLQLVAARAARPQLAAFADRLAPRFLRSVACGAATLSLGVGLGGPAAAGPPPGTAVMVPLDLPTTTTRPTTTSPTTTSTIEPPPTPTAPPATPGTTAATAPNAADPSPAAPATISDHDLVVVAPGGSFWSIAEEEAGERDIELEPFWLALVDLNRERLVDPGNPDLLYPGQVLRLP